MTLATNAVVVQPRDLSKAGLALRRGTVLLCTLGVLVSCGDGSPTSTDDCKRCSVGETRTFALLDYVSMEFVWIAPGTFMMGSPISESGHETDERPQHEVTISQGFWLGKYELTQEQWQGVMGTAPWVGQGSVVEDPLRPAVYLTWEDVQAMIDRLSAERETAVYRLPTEAEWEYACRAGTTGPWSFGDMADHLPAYAWYAANAWNAGMPQGQPVGALRGNPWGLFDMHGNVWEWVQDLYGSYPSEAQVDPEGPTVGTHHVARGGAFGYGAKFTRSAYRGVYAPGRGHYFGVRLVRTG